MTEHPSLADLESALDHILASPSDAGKLQMISARPAVGQRRQMQEATLDEAQGLIGDNWKDRSSARTSDGSANPDAQLTIINSRLVDAVSGSKSRWELAGDQLVVDIDLSHDNLPVGSCLQIGSAMVEITAEPHTGCVKFASRFGNSALRFVSGPVAMQQRRRGANTKIVKSGTIRVGDAVRKVES